MPETTKCQFCSDGNCLLCQMAQPVVAGVSSSHGRIVGEPDGLGPGNRRVPRRITKSPASSLPVGGSRGRPEGRMCPICGVTYLDLLHHYNRKHPDEPQPAP